MPRRITGGAGSSAVAIGASLRGLLDDTERLIARGRHAAAERGWRALAAALARRGARDEAACVQTRLGCHLLERGRPKEAARVFDESVALATEDGAAHLRADARIWGVAARIDAGRLADAEAVCRPLLAEPRPPAGTHLRTLATYARLLIWQRRLDDATRLRCEFVIPPDAPHLYARGMLVRLELLSGRLFEAGVAADALDRALPADADALSRILAATTRLRVLAAAGHLVAAQRTCELIDAVARTARLPLRGVRARLIWIQALRRAQEWSAAHQGERRLRRMAGLSPLLQRVVDGGEPLPLTSSVASSERREAGGLTPQFTLAVQSVLRTRCDVPAIDALLALVAAHGPLDRVDLFVERAGSLLLAGYAGSSAPTTIAERIAVLGGEVGPVVRECGEEVGRPVREAGDIVGAIVIRCARGAAVTLEDVLTYLEGVVGPWVATFDPVASAVHPTSLMPELLGVSASMVALRATVQRAAAAPFAVLIEGESGVGKELVARALHRLGPRRDGPFRDLNCAALTEDLLDAELFGHARGAFTGALTDRRGLIEEADHGTLFLDELADLSPRGQAKLLRVLQEREVRRIGEIQGRPVDVRVVSAANTDMRARAERGTFRPDLLYRLDVIRLGIPPLRARPDDIPLLVRHYWRDATRRMGSAATLSPGVVEALCAYHWPGNVRELQNVVAAMAVLTPARGEVQLAQLPLQMPHRPCRPSAHLAAARSDFERRFIGAALARADGRPTVAARDLGISRQGLAKLIRRHGMDLRASGEHGPS